MKKIIFLATVMTLIVIASCKKLTDLNESPKQAKVASSDALFSNAEKNLVDQETSPSVNENVFRAFAQYWTETTYIDESRYDVLNRRIPDAEFAIVYRDVLMDLKEAKRLIALESVSISSADQKKNKIAITEILTVYAFHRLVDIFGNIPYDQALDIKNVQPSYEDAKAIYQKLFTRLDAAIADLNSAEKGFKDGSDLIYRNGGTAVASWKKFANTLKLKMAISVSDVSDLDPKGKAESAVTAGIFASSGDNATFLYLSVAPNYNPVYENLVASGRHDWVPANTLVDMMNTLSDPRRDNYFTKTSAGVYKGGKYGSSNNYSSCSHVAPYVESADRPANILTYTEALFYLAEAAQRGWSVGGTADSFYNKAITTSIVDDWFGDAATEPTAYLAQPSVAFSTAGTDKLKVIAAQSWIASYERGLVGWTTWRRLDAPTLNPPSGMTNADIPTRFTYPIAEQTVNGPNYTKAASAVGGDKLTTKLFWDKL